MKAPQAAAPVPESVVSVLSNEDGSSGAVASGIFQLTIPGQFPNLNDIIEARKSKFFQYSEMKAKWTRHVELLARAARLPRMLSAHVTILLFEPSMKRDPDGVLAGACKFILDGLQDAAVLDNDGWRTVQSLQSQWYLDRVKPRVVVFLTTKQRLLGELFKIERASK